MGGMPLYRSIVLHCFSTIDVVERVMWLVSSSPYLPDTCYHYNTRNDGEKERV